MTPPNWLTHRTLLLIRQFMTPVTDRGSEENHEFETNPGVGHSHISQSYGNI